MFYILFIGPDNHNRYKLWLKRKNSALNLVLHCMYEMITTKCMEGSFNQDNRKLCMIKIFNCSSKDSCYQNTLFIC